MTNLFGEEYMEIPKKRKPPDKAKRAWENAFQKWSNEASMDGSSPSGCCGFGGICDYCENNHIGRPCVRALNAKAREKRIEIDYSDKDFEKWFYLCAEGGNIMDNNTERHKMVCYELNALYDKKNRDYGDSFHETFVEEGMAMARIRLMDKLNRFCNLTRGQNVPNMADESVRDTLIDLANYAIMTVMELDAEGEQT